MTQPSVWHSIQWHSMTRNKYNRKKYQIEACESADHWIALQNVKPICTEPDRETIHVQNVWKWKQRICVPSNILQQILEIKCIVRTFPDTVHTIYIKTHQLSKAFINTETKMLIMEDIKRMQKFSNVHALQKKLWKISFAQGTGANGKLQHHTVQMAV